MPNVRTARRVAIVALLAAAVAASPGARSSELTVPGRSSAYPAIAAAGHFAAISWGATVKDGATDIYTAVSTDGGNTFGSPVKTNGATPANLSGEQPPRVSLVPRSGRTPSIVVVWTSKAAAGTRLMTARSEDGGKSFSGATAVPGSEAPGNRGWESTSTDANGHVVAIWLDHRELAKPAGGAAAEHMHSQRGAEQKTDGAARAQASKLYFARLDSADSARALTGGVCYCCKTAVAARANMVYAAWRHVYPGNVRDIAFTMSRDGGRTFAPPSRVSNDNWVLDGCPENGPAMAVDANGRIHIVWPTLLPGATPASEPVMALFYASSRDGERFTARQRLPAEGVARHPQIALGAGGRVVAAWEEQEGAARRVVLARAAGDGSAMKFAREAVTDSAPAVYPAIAATGDGIVAVWTSGAQGQTVLRTVRR